LAITGARQIFQIVAIPRAAAGFGSELRATSRAGKFAGKFVDFAYDADLILQEYCRTEEVHYTSEMAGTELLMARSCL